MISGHYASQCRLRILPSFANLVDLGLEVVDYLWWDVVAKDVNEVDALVPRDGFVGGDLNALLDFLDLGPLRNEMCALHLSDSLVRQERALFAVLGSRCGSG